MRDSVVNKRQGPCFCEAWIEVEEAVTRNEQVNEIREFLQWNWELDYKESWVPKNWYFWTVVLEKTRESPLDCKELQVVHPKGNQS